MLARDDHGSFFERLTILRVKAALSRLRLAPPHEHSMIDVFASDGLSPFLAHQSGALSNPSGRHAALKKESRGTHVQEKSVPFYPSPSRGVRFIYLFIQEKSRATPKVKGGISRGLRDF